MPLLGPAAKGVGFRAPHPQNPNAVKDLSNNIVRAPFYVPRPSDDSVWQFPGQYNASLNLVAPVTTLPTGPFYVPKSSDDNAWNLSSVAHNLNLSIQPSPFHSIVWRYNIDDASTWNAKPDASNIIEFLTVGGQVPTKQRRYDFDDAAFWEGEPEPSAILPLLTQQRIYGVGGQAPTKQWHYDYDDASIWQFLVPHNGLLSVVASPFSPVVWRYNIDDPAVWSGSPTKDELLFPLLTAAGQVKSRQWIWGNDDASYWSGQPFAVSSMQVQLTSLGKVPTKQWHSDIDDAAVWWNWINRNITISTVVNKPLTLPAQTFILSSDEPWALTTQRNLQTDSVVLPPFKSRQSKFDADDPSVWYDWINRNSVNITTAFVPPNPLVPVFYRFHNDDPAIWQQPPQRSIGLPFVPPIVNRWRLDVPDDQPWSLSIRYNLAGSITAVPFVLRQPQFSIDDPSHWSFTLRRNQPLSTPTQSPFSVRWRSDIDEPALWQRLIFRSIALPTVPAINNRYFRYIPDDQPWTALIHRNTGAMLTVTAPPPPFHSRQPSFAFDDHSSYQWPMKSSIILSLKWNINLERIGNTLAERRIALASLERHIVVTTPEIRMAGTKIETRIATTTPETRIAIAPDEDT